MSKRISLLILILFFVAMIGTNPIKRASANPMSMSSYNAGQATVILSNASMPEAEVNISISTRKYSESSSTGPTFTHTIEMQSSFSIWCDVSHNSTIAFVYPGSWSNQITSIVSNLDLYIQLDGVPISYLSVNGSSLSFDLENPEEYEKWQFLESQDLAVFNASLQAGVESLLEVQASVNVTSTADIFEFEYCVGSARTWNGSTQETVRMSVENNDLFLSSQFKPTDSLTVSEEGSRFVGIWSLDIASFSGDYVAFECTQKMWPYTTTTPPLSPQLVLLAAGSLVTIALAVIIIMKKSGRLNL